MDVMHTLKVGEILQSVWGFEQTNVQFFQVVKVTPKMVFVREIPSHESSNNGDMTGTVVPVKGAFASDKVLRRKVLFDWQDREKIYITDYSTASRWSGEPVRFSSYA